MSKAYASKGEEARAEQLPEYDGGDAGPRGPTVDAPFNFPVNDPLPEYTATSPTSPLSPSASASASSSSASAAGASSSRRGPWRPIAIPQVSPEKSAAFLSAYSPALLGRGITEQSWREFLTTMSAFLAAKVSEQALNHAADMAKAFGNRPARHYKAVWRDIAATGREVSDSARSGNIGGVIGGVIGGAIHLPITAALQTVGAVVSLPSAAANAVVRRPQTPLERAAVYAGAANKDWFAARELIVSLKTTPELATLLGEQPKTLVDLAKAGGVKAGASGQLSALTPRIADLEIANDAKLDIGHGTLWLVVLNTDEKGR